MGGIEWVLCFIGAGIFLICLGVWFFVRRHRTTSDEPTTNPGLIQPDGPPGRPPSVSPAMVGAVLDGKADVRDLFLAVIDLAVEGYVTIKPMASHQGGAPSDWVISRTGQAAHDLRDFETTMLAGPAGDGRPGRATTLSALFTGDADTVKTGLTQLRTSVSRAGWFTDDSQAPQHRSLWSAGGGVMILVGLAVAVIALMAGFRATPWPGLIGAACIVVSGLVLISLARLHPVSTAAGDRTRAQVQRYRTWIEALQPHDIVPDTAATTFNTNIVPAMAFGLSATFATVFDTAVARQRNWGGQLDIPTTWLDVPPALLTPRVALLDQLLDEAARLATRAGIT